jgi:hypothetical protein
VLRAFYSRHESIQRQSIRRYSRDTFGHYRTGALKNFAVLVSRERNAFLTVTRADFDGFLDFCGWNCFQKSLSMARVAVISLKACGVWPVRNVQSLSNMAAAQTELQG